MQGGTESAGGGFKKDRLSMLNRLKSALPGLLRDQRLDSLEYVVVDVETTGLDMPPKALIFEIAAVRVTLDAELNHISSFVRPSLEIRPEVQELTGVYSHHIQNAPEPEQTLPDIFSFIEGSVFASYPLFFDHGHLNYACKKTLGKKLSGRKLCVRSLFEFLYPDPQPRSLEHALRMHEIDLPHRHRALDDALATARLLTVLLRISMNRGYTHFYELIRDVNGYMYNRGHGAYHMRY